MSGYGTRFVETEALLALMSDDEDGAEAIVKDMLPGERRALAEACSALSALCSERCAVCDGSEFTDRGGKTHVVTYMRSGRVIHHRDCQLPEDGDQ